MNIIALGPAGSNGHSIARKIQSSIIPQFSISFVDTNDDVLKKVAGGGCIGVVPIENSYEGWVREVVRFWLHAKARPYVIGEVHLPINHQLLVHSSIESVKQVSAVISHPQALGQCRNSLLALGITETQSEKSTSLAAEKVAIGALDPTVAALAAPIAGEVYKLKVLKEHMEDDGDNTTRFHVLGGQPMLSTGKDKTAMLFFAENKPRSLYNALSCICMYDTNMSSIHSIPLGKIGKYAFYVEFDGHIDSGEGKQIMKRLETVTEERIFLGSFPRGEYI